MSQNNRDRRLDILRLFMMHDAMADAAGECENIEHVKTESNCGDLSDRSTNDEDIIDDDDDDDATVSFSGREEGEETDDEQDISQDESDSVKLVPTNTLVESTQQQQHQCHLCPKNFPKLHCLTRHLKRHETPPLPPKTHECSHCHKPFASAGNLKKHMLTHTGERPFACAYCPSSFNQKIHAKIHERMHTGEKPYVCLMDGCLRAFADPKSVIWHRRMHTGERPYTCTVCSRTFRCKRGMFKHMRIHTGEKPYTCNVCGLAFSQNGNMKTHQKNIHGIGKLVTEVVHKVVAAHAVIVDDLKVGVGLGGLCGSHVQ